MKYCSLAAILFVFFLCGSCASVNITLPSEGHRIAADFSGIVHAGETNTQEEFDHLNYMGVSWVLHTFYWGRIEPQQNNWNFESYDVVVNNAGKAGIKVLGVLAYDNRWIHPDQKGHDYIPPERMPDFLNYVRKTVEYFKGRVGAWCIWNEPNSSRFWNGTVDEYAELIRQAADAIKETDSDVIVLGGAFNRNVTGLPKKMINRLFESGAMENVDAVAFHPYEISANRSLKLYKQFEEIVNQYGYKDKIWITEVGYPTGGWYPTKVSEEKFPLRVVKTFALLAAGGARRLFWYQMFDSSNPSKSNSEDFFGLVRSENDYTSKGAEAFRLCALYISGSVCYALTQDNLPASLRVFYFKRENGGTLVLWEDGFGSATQVSLKLPGIEHLRHDIVTGDASSVNSDITIKAGSEPVFITWRTVHDSSENEKNPVIMGTR
ncbi:MAG: beta-galactosidase [Brevinematales bacterium]|nr:beta-galactosidase [Brevinematales bacterium]